MKNLQCYKILPLLSTFLISFAAQPAMAQRNFQCSYYGEPIPSEIKMTNANDKAKQLIEKILSVVGLKPNFEIRAANVPNAAAVILNKKRYILYNPTFIAQINDAADNNWAGISIIAHEIGHHLNGHTLEKGGSRPELELEADEFSGFVLCKLGASLADAQAAMTVAASQKSSHTHPGKRERLLSIADGWNNAHDQIAGINNGMRSSDRAERPAMVKIPEPEAAALDEREIAFDVYFNADNDSQFFITTKGNLVSVEDDSVFLIGRLSESNKRGYRLMLSDKNYNYLYIAPKGEIVNGAGKKVGLIEKHR